MKGLTLIEILISVFLIFLLASLFVSVGLNFYKSQQLRINSQEILQTLRRAQMRAMLTELDSSFGVYLTNNSYTLFKGDSFLQRDPQYEEVFNLPQIVKVSGMSEIVFLKSEGLPKENPPFCNDTCTPCDTLSWWFCRQQDGCSWSWRSFECSGVCTPCDTYQSSGDCEGQLGCNWYTSTRGGDIIISSDGINQIININEVGRINLQ
jgi:type II secretory pathway pseudopilin PulG